MHLYESSEIVLSIFQQLITFFNEIRDKNCKFRSLHKLIFAYYGSGFRWLKKLELPRVNINPYLERGLHFMKANECYFS